MKNGLLDILAERQGAFISDLRLRPEKKWAALGDMWRMRQKEKYPLSEWSEAVSYLLGCDVHFESYGEVQRNLKPFALRVK